MLYSHNQQYPTKLPDRIRLSNGLTRTDSSTFTAEEIADAGYVEVSDAPEVSETIRQVVWSGTDWIVTNYTEEELRDREWVRIRTIRDGTIANMAWRVERCLSEIRLGLPTTDDLQELDAYIQALRDVTLQPDPFNITWPALSSSQTTDTGNV